MVVQATLAQLGQGQHPEPQFLSLIWTVAEGQLLQAGEGQCVPVSAAYRTVAGSDCHCVL